MISRSTLIGALVVVELAILGAAARAVGGGSATTRWNFAPSFGHAPEPTSTTLDKTFATGATPHVVVDVDRAAVTIRTGPPASVRVYGTMRVSGYISGVKPSLSAVRTLDGVRVNVESGLVRVHRGSLEREVRLTVPPGAEVEIASAGSVDSSGLQAKLTAHVESGGVRIVNHRGDVDVTTGEGAIELVDVQSSSIAARSDDGALKLTSSGADHIDAHTASGTITAVGLRAADGALATEDGGVDVTFAPESDASVNLHTGDGRITGVGTPASEDAADTRSVRLGSGRGRFTISTSSGSIAVNQGARV